MQEVLLAPLLTRSPVTATDELSLFLLFKFQNRIPNEPR